MNIVKMIRYEVSAIEFIALKYDLNGIYISLKGTYGVSKYRRI